MPRTATSPSVRLLSLRAAKEIGNGEIRTGTRTPNGSGSPADERGGADREGDRAPAARRYDGASARTARAVTRGAGARGVLHSAHEVSGRVSDHRQVESRERANAGRWLQVPVRSTRQDRYHREAAAREARLFLLVRQRGCRQGQGDHLSRPSCWRTHRGVLVYRPDRRLGTHERHAQVGERAYVREALRLL